MRPLLVEEIASLLRGRDRPMTVDEIALTVRARRADVEEALHVGPFHVAAVPEGGNHRATYWAASPAVPQPHARTSGPSQNERILAVLADRRPHSMHEIHARAGFMRLNSRVSDLRGRGYEIACERIGGDYVYTLLSAPGDLLDEPAAADSLIESADPDPLTVAAGSSSGSSVADAPGDVEPPWHADEEPSDDGPRSILTLFPASRGAYGEAA